jgi:hypothetical protein
MCGYGGVLGVLSTCLHGGPNNKCMSLVTMTLPTVETREFLQFVGLGVARDDITQETARVM